MKLESVLDRTAEAISQFVNANHDTIDVKLMIGSGVFTRFAKSFFLASSNSLGFLPLATGFPSLLAPFTRYSLEHSRSSDYSVEQRFPMELADLRLKTDVRFSMLRTERI
jgi:hypothetical protein